MATELAKAYVQIVPSADGIKGSLEQTLGKEASDAGKKSGDSIASGIKKAVLKLGLGALVVKGISEATGAITGLVQDSLSSFADTEQLEGGVQKLFGEDYEAVIENANAAFKTVGISANDYMETVTSFSASLIGSLEGDTARAADLANLAMVDMADNANTFGTDIASIQNAYQGFAKGNYTMLDNLKLGFGGTESEMERLLETASELTGRDYDIESFADIIDAIHVIQEDMNIAGTTTNEAASTISGSIGMMSAAWENFLGSMMSGDERIAETTQYLVDAVIGTVDLIVGVLPTIIPNLINGIVNVANALIPEIPGIITTLLPPIMEGIKALLTGLMAILPELLQVLMDVLPMAIDAILEMLPLLTQTAIDLIVVLANGLIAALPTLVPAIVDIILTLVDTLVNNIELVVDVSIQIIYALIEGIIRSIPVLIEKVPVIIEKLIGALISSLPKLFSLGADILGMIGKGILSGIGLLGDIAGQVWKAIKGAFSNAFEGALDIGKQLCNGLKNGLSKGVDTVVSAAKSVGSKVINGVKGIFGIHSPSKEFAWIGEMCDAGLAEGLEGMSDTVADAKADIRAEMSEDMNLGSAISASGLVSSQLAITSSGIGDTDIAGAVASAVYNALDNLTIRAEMAPKMDKFFESIRAEAIAYQRRTGNEAWA